MAKMTIFYSPPHEPEPWRGFEPPVKPEFKRGKMTQHQYRQVMKAYYKTLDEAKMNSLPIGNPSICPQNISHVKPGELIQWHWKYEIKDGKIYLEI